MCGARIFDHFCFPFSKLKLVFKFWAGAIFCFGGVGELGLEVSVFEANGKVAE